MGMNIFHQLCCRSSIWERLTATRIVPWALREVDLGDNALEVGPGYGANVRTLRERAPLLTGLEIDSKLAARLRTRHAGELRVIDGDGTAMPLPDKEFSSVVCFTMLHHVPTPSAQDALFAEAFRVLRPGGVFAGSDGLDSTAFRLMHIGDTCVPVPPDTLTGRLERLGFTDIEIATAPTMFRFSARKE
ncbi:class I SAM-dependent methyltransferase [Nocardia huaxiensis]|uniref:Class I SAM-dependent methyltransferase n=1 Tax=Nocardia huaxiensis TaxID=2755382 RepID=A0A7D6VCB5_9NOCA|nr:class I SAM-dependent methyltransferase [Nocardia huaxiensis]QLY29397.1 class I SAM-dependent methyltransferase [Nocardia huaxiensis]UFS97121.1 class I SAM-dependent methyltransferase [Nocardia huaxiensis]